MFKVILSLSFSFIAFFGFCQKPNVDSLLQLADNQEGMQLVETLNQLSQSTLSIDVDQSKSFAQRALKEAEALNDWKGMAAAHDNFGLALMSKFDAERAMSAFFKSLNIRDEHHDEAGQMVSRIHIGRAFFQMEEYAQAEESFIKSLGIAQKLEAYTVAADAFQGLGEVYLAQKIYGKSLEQYEQSLQLWLASEDFQNASNIATKLGDISASLGNHESAINYFQTSLNLYQELGDQSQIAALKTRISQSLLGQDMPGEAMRFDEEAMAIRQSMNDSVGMAESLKNMGLAKLKMRDFENAKPYFQRSFSILNSVEVRPEVPRILNAIAGAYAEMGDSENAYRTQLAFSKSRDENFNQEKATALLKLTTMYESKFEAREQQAQIALLEVENATSRKISYFLFAMLGLIGLLLTNLYISYRRKQKDHQLLAAKNEESIRQKNEIDLKNQELELKNTSLDLLNKKLVDEIAERENIEKSSFARDRFLATMSHEMRTPLNVIIGLTHILLESNPRADQAEQLRTLQFSANDLVVFINDVLDFSKIEAGKLIVEDRPFKPAKVFHEVKAKFEKKAEEAGVLFNFFQDPKLPENLLGDDARFMQIISNLLANTFKHTSEGYVKVDIALHELKGQKAVVKIMVEGSDGGIKRNIFDDDSLSNFEAREELSVYESQQFALTITKRLVELQNGKLKVDIDEGKSTAFVVVLPFKIAPSGKNSQPIVVQKNYGNLEGLRIMVVEDNRINQLVVAKMLKKVGAKISTANNGLEALELFDEEDFDLILMDIQMPVMDGYRATAEIRRHPNVDKRDLPIIALTASAFLTEKEKAVLFGMNDHVGKPFSPDELLEKIQGCLELHRSA